MKLGSHELMKAAYNKTNLNLKRNLNMNPSKNIVTLKELEFYRRPGGLERANRHIKWAIDPFKFRKIELIQSLKETVNEIEELDKLNNPIRKHNIFPHNIEDESSNENVIYHTVEMLKQLDVKKHYHVTQSLKKGLCYLGINSPRTHFKMCELFSLASSMDELEARIARLKKRAGKLMKAWGYEPHVRWYDVYMSLLASLALPENELIRLIATLSLRGGWLNVAEFYNTDFHRFASMYEAGEGKLFSRMGIHFYWKMCGTEGMKTYARMGGLETETETIDGELNDGIKRCLIKEAIRGLRYSRYEKEVKERCKSFPNDCNIVVNRDDAKSLGFCRWGIEDCLSDYSLNNYSLNNYNYLPLKIFQGDDGRYASQLELIVDTYLKSYYENTLFPIHFPHRHRRWSEKY